MDAIVETVYNKTEWRSKLARTKSNIEKAECILTMIERMERRYANSISSAQLFSTQFFSVEYKSRAALQKKAIIRLRDYFNNLVMEIQL